jgi:hypothetical protein
LRVTDGEHERMVAAVDRLLRDAALGDLDQRLEVGGVAEP